MIVIAWFCLFIQAGIVIASLLGYGIFTARPDWLMVVDPGARFFTWAFYGFAVGNMLFGGLAVMAESFGRNGRAAYWTFSAVYLVSLASELLGTTYGIPFGAYSYTESLGTKWFGRVPILIPLSWFTMSWACWMIARSRTHGLRAVAFATILLVAWDLLLDPAMSKVTSYWIWGEVGAYYGMPWMNLFGWGVTGLLLFLLLYRFAPSPVGELRFSFLIYAINFALPFGFCILNGYWLAVCAGPAAIALGYLFFRRSIAGRDERLVGAAQTSSG